MKIKTLIYWKKWTDVPISPYVSKQNHVIDIGESVIEIGSPVDIFNSTDPLS